MKPIFDELHEEVLKLKIPQSEKQSLIDKLKTAKQTRLLNKCTLEVNDSISYKPETIEKGDIISTIPNGLVHPAVVIKVDKIKKIVYALPVTNDLNFLGNITEVKSRFITGSLTISLQILTIEDALKYWKGTIGNTVECNKLIRAFKSYYKYTFKI